MKNIFKTYGSEIIGSILCLILGLLSGYSVSSGDSIWFSSINKPSFNPPNWIFGPVWTVLYLMMGVALGKIWNIRQQNPSLFILFGCQFFFNLLWSPLFFHFHRIDLALLDISLLWLSLILLLISAKKHINIVMLLLPYLLWVSFAFILNFAIFQLN